MTNNKSTSILQYHGTSENPDIKIFVSHRIDQESELIDNPIYIPVRSGAVFDKRTGVKLLGDDTGDNICEKNKSYCETTTQYWAWKNVEADYYGLCHYRRYFSFADEQLPVCEGNWAVFDILDKATIEKTGNGCTFDAKKITDYDIIVGDKFTMPQTIYEQWDSAPFLYKEDLDCLLSIVKDLYPDFYEIADEYIHGHLFYPCNLFIMKKKYFFEYSEFLFTILAEAEKRIDISKYTVVQTRLFGHFAERLLGIWCVKKLQDDKSIKFKTQQWFFVKNPQSLKPVMPISDNSVPLMFVCSDYYVPYCITTLSSIAKASDKNRTYDILILTNSGMTNESKALLTKSLAAYQNFVIRFVNVEPFLSQYPDYQKIVAGIVGEQRFDSLLMIRMFSPFLLSSYKKYIWLDCDLIAKEDVGNLFDTDLNGKMIGAVHDIIFNCFLNGSAPAWQPFYKNEFNMQNPYNYVNAGVIVMDAEKYRQKYTFESILEKVKTEPYQIYEQDVFNIIIENDVHFVDEKWNLFTMGGNYKEQMNFAPANMYFTYMNAREKPALIHFAGSDKPWNNPYTDMSLEFWQAAKETPVYEIIMGRMIDARSNWFISMDNRYQRITQLENNIHSRKFLLKCLLGQGLLFKICRKIWRKLRRR